MDIPKCPKCEGDIRIEVDASVGYTPVRIEPGGILIAQRCEGANELDSFTLYCIDCSEEFFLSDLGLRDWQDETTWIFLQQRAVESERARLQTIAAHITAERGLP